MKITPEIIMDIVAREFSLTVNDLKSRNREKRVSTARALAMDLINDRCGLPLGHIALMFNRSYPTAYSNHRTFRKELTQASWQDIERILAARLKTFDGYVV